MPDDVAGDIFEGIKDVAGSVVSVAGEEFKKVGKTVVGQVTGQTPQQEADAKQQVTELNKKDKEFSSQGEQEVKAKINAYYQEYASKKRKQQMQQEQSEKAKVEEKKEIVQLKKKEAVDVVVAQAKGNAEVKNYGAE